MASCPRAIWNQRLYRLIFRTAQILGFMTLVSELIHHKEASAWTYHYSPNASSWKTSRAFCQKHYTDLVAIQNRREIQHLNEVIPHFSSYYWIGIRKMNDTWRWVGTLKALTKEAENWADNEPNNKKNNQDCVEMYIKRQTAPGTWNDEPCWKKKRALCYTASCGDLSCHRQGECVETIGNYSCSCYPGFYGPECEFVKECGELSLPAHALRNCTHPRANFSLNSKCSFRCGPGYALRGASELECLASGMWTSEAPECVALQCQDLMVPDKAQMNCSHPPGHLKFQSSCSFSCAKGYALVGAPELQCLDTGGWSAPLPECRGAAPTPTPGVRCPAPLIPAQGTVSCKHHLGRFRANTTCYFACNGGFALTGESALTCRRSGHWTAPAPQCRAVTCPELRVADPMVVNCSGPWGRANYGSSCSFQCPEAQLLNGSARAVCQADGQWSTPVPFCQAEPLSVQQILTYVGPAVASTAGLGSGLLLLALLRRRRRQNGK